MFSINVLLRKARNIFSDIQVKGLHILKNKVPKRKKDTYSVHCLTGSIVTSGDDLEMETLGCAVSK